MLTAAADRCSTPDEIPVLAPRPFLKWAGGKRQLLPQLRRFYPSTFRTYWEPFVGSGAVFFDLCAAGRLAGHDTVLADRNPDLVGCYRVVRDEVDALVRELRRLEAGHAADATGHYYRVRNEEFNPARRLATGAASPSPYSAYLAARLIYLNRTGFNGLFRLNRKGDFNVPLGRYVRPTVCDEPNVRAVSAVLRAPRMRIELDAFDAVLSGARSGDFVYIDPPYAPLSTTSFFVAYTSHGFTPDDQRRLQQVVIELATRGCHVVVSNSTAPLIAELYESNASASRAGLQAHRVPARRAINSDATKRGGVLELIISNVTPTD